MTEIDIFKVLDFIRDNAKKYAKAKASRVYLEEYRKSKKAMLMQEAALEGIGAANAQEVRAYAHPDYLAVLEGIKEAVEMEEGLRWTLIAAQAKAEVWRSLQANSRIEARTI